MQTYTPLAVQVRPQTLVDFVGQDHLVGASGPIKLMIESNKPYSVIFWGPPGCGKTTLAEIIANSIHAQFFKLSAVSAGKKEIKDIIDKIKIDKEQQLYSGENKGKSIYNVLFLDEIHRFNKAQQDFLLPYVENGTLILIGATTENPSFEVNSALLSRCRVFVLNPLSIAELSILIQRTAKTLKIKINKEALEFLAEFANGDGRIAINAIEIASKEIVKDKKVTLQLIKLVLQTKALLYDKGAEEHYNTISAFIKSMRASNIDAALYYLARMVEAGEDPIFIARRMVVFASEDVASPTALVVANAVFQACQQIGLPECQENLAAGVVYLAKAEKDRSAYDAYFAALADVKTYGNLAIPLKIRNAPTKLMKELNYGKGYEMYSGESLLPDKLKNKKYYKK